MVELVVEQNTGLQAVAQGQRPAETLSPLAKAQQRARGILDCYIGKAPMPRDIKQLQPEKYAALIEEVHSAVYYGKFDKTKRLLHDLQQTGQLTDENALAFLFQAAAIQSNKESGQPEQRPTHNTLAELASAQLALTIAHQTK